MNDDVIAALDQMMRGMVDLARVLFAHYSGCVEAGFSEDQALHLTTEFQRTLQIMPAIGGGEE